MGIGETVLFGIGIVCLTVVVLYMMYIAQRGE